MRLVKSLKWTRRLRRLCHCMSSECDLPLLSASSKFCSILRCHSLSLFIFTALFSELKEVELSAVWCTIRLGKRVNEAGFPAYPKDFCWSLSRFKYGAFENGLSEIKKCLDSSKAKF